MLPVGVRSIFIFKNSPRWRVLYDKLVVATVIRGGMRANAVAIVEKLPERVGGDGATTVKVFKNALWTALRTVFRPKSLLFGLKTVLYNRPGRWLDPDTNFRLACQRSRCCGFTKRPLEWLRFLGPSCGSDRHTHAHQGIFLFKND